MPTTSSSRLAVMPPCTARENPRCGRAGVNATHTVLPSRRGARRRPPGLSVPHTKQPFERKTSSFMIQLYQKLVVDGGPGYLRDLMWRWGLVALLLGPMAGAAPLTESSQGRRAIRGAPVEIAHESDALRALRAFDEESFPRPGGPPSFAPDTRSASLTGGVGPDAVPAELRSPEQAKRA